MAHPKIKLTYFDVEGGGEKVRLTLALGGIAFEDDRVPFDQWPARKATTPQGQLPVLTVDGFEHPVTQSGAILRWAGRLAGLYPTDPHLQLRVDEVIGVEEDLLRALVPTFRVTREPEAYGHAADLPEAARTALQKAMRANVVKPDGALSKFLRYAEALLARNAPNPWFVGSEPTIADAQIFASIRFLRKGVAVGLPTTAVDAYPRLVAFEAAFAALPAVAAHYTKRGEPALIPPAAAPASGS